MFRANRILWLIWVTVAAAGCGVFNKPPPPPPPPLVPLGATTIHVDHFYGSPLSGPKAVNALKVLPEQSLAVEVSFIAIKTLPAGLQPLGTRARLIVASRAASPVLATATLTRSAVFAPNWPFLVSPTSRAQLVWQGAGIVAEGTTARFEISDREKVAMPILSRIGYRRFAVQVTQPPPQSDAPPTQPAADDSLLATTLPSTEPASQPATFPTTDPTTEPTTGPALMPTTSPAKTPGQVRIQLAVVLDDFETAASAAVESGDSDNSTISTAAPTTAPSNRPARLQYETVLLDPMTVDLKSLRTGKPMQVMVAVPFMFRDGTNQFVAARIRIGQARPSDPAYVALCDSANEQMAKHSAAALADAALRPVQSADSATLYNTLAAMVYPQTRRSSVAYLAQWSGAHLCEDVALSCDESVLADLNSNLALTVGAGSLDRSAIGWRMDSITLNLLSTMQNKGTLPPELAAILADRLGEAGRHPSAMQEILVALSGPNDLTQRILATNRLYLEDSSPGSRARAYEWLRSRGAEPAGYDPLGAPKDRRAALENYAAAQAAASTQPTTNSVGVLQ